MFKNKRIRIGMAVVALVAIAVMLLGSVASAVVLNPDTVKAFVRKSNGDVVIYQAGDYTLKDSLIQRYLKRYSQGQYVSLEWNVEGPKGDIGAPGETGIQGVAGEKGDTGDLGLQGLQGEQGLKGDAGDKGDTGLQGETGENGADGIAGTNGIDGTNGKDGQQGLVFLVPKDADWAVIEGGAGANLSFYPVAKNFTFSLMAYGLEEGIDYSLIYYADKADRETNWGGDNPGAFIASGTTDAIGNLVIFGSKDLGMDLPSGGDKNISNYDYSGAPDFYVNAHGAKIWLVPSECYDEETTKVTVWSPDRFLFETDLIHYTQVVD